MNAPCVVVLVALAALAVADEKYTTKYDSVDVDGVLRNDRLMLNYVNCLLGKGKCSPDGVELKSHIKEGLETGCAKCSAKQAEAARKVLKHLYEKKPETFKALEAEYDSEGNYRKKYEAEAKKEGINL